MQTRKTRRQFIQNLGVLPCGLFSPRHLSPKTLGFSTTSSRQENDSYFLTELKLAQSDFHNNTDYLSFRNHLADRACDPQLKRYLKQPTLTSPTPPQWSWVLGVASSAKASAIGIVLDYADDYGLAGEEEHPYANHLSFSEWIRGFPLKDWSDCLVAGSLFNIYQRTGSDLTTLPQFAYDHWIDSVLHQSHGLLLWSCQVTELIRCIGGLTSAEADKLRRGWGSQHPEALSDLEAIYYEGTGQPLTEILDERSSRREFITFSPNYPLARWLWESHVQSH